MNLHSVTYNPSLVTVSSPKLKILHFVCKWERITDKQTDNPITRSPPHPADLSGRGHKNFGTIVKVLS